MGVNAIKSEVSERLERLEYLRKERNAYVQGVITMVDDILGSEHTDNRFCLDKFKSQMKEMLAIDLDAVKRMYRNAMLVDFSLGDLVELLFMYDESIDICKIRWESSDGLIEKTWDCRFLNQGNVIKAMIYVTSRSDAYNNYVRDLEHEIDNVRNELEDLMRN